MVAAREGVRSVSSTANFGFCYEQLVNIGTAYKRMDFVRPFDTIVIGSGIGGLTCAALLAKHAQERVLVLERHYTAGGFTHAFRRPGFEWDVGVHYIGDVSAPERPLRRMFDHLTDGRLAWADMGDVYDAIEVAGRRYEYVRGKEAFRARMKAYFPSESKAIDAYLRKVVAAAKWSRAFFTEKALPPALSRMVGGALRWPALRYARRTTAEVLDTLTHNEELKAVLTGQWGDYGLPPSESSFFIHALVAHHYLRGAAYPVGGAANIARNIVPVIEAQGGAVVVRAEVHELVLDSDRAVGVRMADGRILRARRLVSDAGVAITYGQLLPEEARQRFGLASPREHLRASLAHLSLYLGLDRTAAQLGLHKTNRWVYPGPDHDRSLRTFAADPTSSFPVIYLSFPSAKDPDFERRYPGRATIEAIVPASYALFERFQEALAGRPDPEYQVFKQMLSERLLKRVIELLPSIEGHVTHVELSTPLSTRRFTAHPHGEIYGLAHTPARFADRSLGPRTPIQGLYLAGADACCAGVVGAMQGGVLAASTILGRNLIPAMLAASGELESS